MLTFGPAYFEQLGYTLFTRQETQKKIRQLSSDYPKLVEVLICFTLFLKN